MGLVYHKEDQKWEKWYKEIEDSHMLTQFKIEQDCNPSEILVGCG